MVERGGRKGYITERNGRSSWEQQGIIAFCTCQWNEWRLVCNHNLWNYRTGRFQIDTFRKLMIWHWWQSPFLCLLLCSKKMLLAKRVTLKIERTASSGGQRKLTYFMYFSWPTLEAELLISTFSFLFTCCLCAIYLQIFNVYLRLTFRNRASSI